jgi:hypothetical protein
VQKTVTGGHGDCYGNIYPGGLLPSRTKENMKSPNGAGKVVLKGVVLPHSWKADGAVELVKLSCTGERDYIISNDETVPGIREQIRFPVLVEGNIQVSEDGKEYISINRFKRIKWGYLNEKVC